MKEKKHGNWEKIVSGIKKHALSREPGIDGILVTVGLCIIGSYPCLASMSPQNKPAGPLPMITGGFAGFSAAFSGI